MMESVCMSVCLCVLVRQGELGGCTDEWRKGEGTDKASGKIQKVSGGNGS